MKKALCALTIPLLLFAFASSRATTLPPGFYDQFVTGYFSQPTALNVAPDGRMFVCEKNGTLKMYSGGQVVSYLSLNVSSESERGLLGVAFDPNFQSNRFFYVYYTSNGSSMNPLPSPKNRVSRFQEVGGVGKASTEQILIDNIPSDAGNHNGGCLRFGADGKLYIATGDGGADHTNSQNLGTLAGKILRINTDGSIPADNPYYDTAGARQEIFCLGLRNPYRFNFRPGTNTMYIGDVGQNTWEEVDVSAPGANYGWPTTEGTFDQAAYPPFTEPLFTYQHSSQSAAIIGGCFTKTVDFPAGFYDAYFYGDFVRNQINFLTVTTDNGFTGNSLFEDASTPSDFYCGANGGLYYVSYGNGHLRQIVYRPALTSFKLNGYYVVGGNNPLLLLQLGQPAAVGGSKLGLQTSNPAVAYVPSVVSVQGGKLYGSLYVKTAPVSVKTTVTLSGIDGISIKTLTLNLLPPSIYTLTPSQATVKGGTDVLLAASLNGPAPSGGWSFTASSDNASATVPGTGTIPSGKTRTSIAVTTSPVTSSQTCNVTVTSGGVTKTSALTITP